MLVMYAAVARLADVTTPHLPSAANPWSTSGLWKALAYQAVKNSQSTVGELRNAIHAADAGDQDFHSTFVGQLVSRPGLARAIVEGNEDTAHLVADSISTHGTDAQYEAIIRDIEIDGIWPDLRLPRVWLRGALLS
ncbi:hypothetical protein [Microbacterium sp. 77mftsu3.1]|uniref:hypothetical protein n=1 Tax=Microbacterium sp. 77mftsu3.1 TaxID=1761802 RepID=UPI000B8187DF|nr:hypothetical protein [Microbacterium sp. 77mftsu3.1]